jgi:hypothetical protein
MTRRICLGFNATAPVTAAMRPWIEENFSDPFSSHAVGQRTRRYP